MTPEKFSDSQQQEAWRAYACAAFHTFAMNPNLTNEETVKMTGELADLMMAEEMKRSRG